MYLFALAVLPSCLGQIQGGSVPGGSRHPCFVQSESSPPASRKRSEGDEQGPTQPNASQLPWKYLCPALLGK